MMIITKNICGKLYFYFAIRALNKQTPYCDNINMGRTIISTFAFEQHRSISSI